MAIQPPPARAPRKRSLHRPEGRLLRPRLRVGCLGCGGVLILVVLLVVGGGYWLFVAQAHAAVTAPASLVVYNQPVDVDHKPGAPGQALTAGNMSAPAQRPRRDPVPRRLVRAHVAGHHRDADRGGAAKDGNLQSASLVQKVGRTFTNVQHLVSGASFQVGGHSVSARCEGHSSRSSCARTTPT